MTKINLKEKDNSITFAEFVFAVLGMCFTLALLFTGVIFLLKLVF